MKRLLPAILGAELACNALAQTAGFGPSNPFYATSRLPFQAPLFDKIKDSDYQPAIEAGIAQQLKEIEAIANNPAPPDFANTILALEKSGQLLARVQRAFGAVTQANTNPELQKVQEAETPKLAAVQDAEFLNPALYARVEAVYQKRNAAGLDAESQRLVEHTWQGFTHAGARLNEADRTRMRQINEQIAVLSNAFRRKLLGAARGAAFHTDDRAALAGLTDAEIAAAEASAQARKQTGYTLPMQNTTQQSAFESLSNRRTRQALFELSWNRADRSNENDTRDTIAQLAKLRAERAKLLGYPNFAAWKIEDQRAKTPDAVMKFLDQLVLPARANVEREAKEIQALIDLQKGGFTLAPYDWNYYAEQVRQTKFDIDEAAVRPYFELNRVLVDGVFYAATELYGIHFKERKEFPVYQPDVRVFEVTDADGKPLALFYCDYFKRDNKQGGAWTSAFVPRSKLMGTLTVALNVANLPKPASGEPALISYDDVRTMFHEFGHALQGMFTDVLYSSLGGNIPRDFVEVPSQFNEHWMDDPKVFAHFARHYKTGAPMPPELAAKLRRSQTFNQGYALTELLAAAELDMQWHLLPADAPKQSPEAFERAVLEKVRLGIPAVPPRYRSTYFLHVWGGGYSAGYYAYLWSEMLDDDAFAWFTEHGGLTRANGDRFRQMVLSKGNTEDLETVYERWRGGKPSIQPLLQQRGLVARGK